MYKYSKLVKERMLKDNFLAFLWVFYRILSSCNYILPSFHNNNSSDDKKFEEELTVGQEVKRIIFADFDSIAMKTLRDGNS